MWCAVEKYWCLAGSMFIEPTYLDAKLADLTMRSMGRTTVVFHIKV